MPAHNAAEFLDTAVASILTQTYRRLELILVNDGSADRTLSLMRAWARRDHRVRVLNLRTNVGESAAANAGFRLSKGAYIARMDADDIAYPERIAHQVAFLDSHPRYIVVGCQADVIDESGNVIGKKTFPTDHATIYREYCSVHPMLHPGIMVRRALLPYADRLWANQAEPNDDYFTLLELLQYGKFTNTPKTLMRYRMHEHNKSMQHVKSKFWNSVKIRLHAVRHFHYTMSGDAWLKLLLQCGVVLLLPERAVLGIYFWSRGMKSFEVAFPIVAQTQAALEKLIFGSIAKPALSLTTGLVVVVHSLVTHGPLAMWQRAKMG
jgi:glycosyltransferase involved in cell wall biosynthesis